MTNLKMIKEFCKDYFEDIKVNNEMIKEVERMFNEFMLNKESLGLEHDIELFFNENEFGIECELESWN